MPHDYHVKVLHLADLHLGARSHALGDKSSLRSQDFLDAFNRAVAFALAPENAIDLVCIAGDRDVGGELRKTL